jgi:hypothetical protein
MSRTVIGRAVTVGAIVATMVVCGKARAGGINLFGVGSNSCGTWLRFDQADNYNHTIMVAWLDGFLSAENVSRQLAGLSGSLGDGTDINGRPAWVTQYCQAHPLDALYVAAWALVQELEKTAR